MSHEQHHINRKEIFLRKTQTRKEIKVQSIDQDDEERDSNYGRSAPFNQHQPLQQFPPHPMNLQQIGPYGSHPHPAYRMPPPRDVHEYDEEEEGDEEEGEEGEEEEYEEDDEHHNFGERGLKRGGFQQMYYSNKKGNPQHPPPYGYPEQMYQTPPPQHFQPYLYHPMRMAPRYAPHLLAPAQNQGHGYHNPGVYPPHLKPGELMYDRMGHPIRPYVTEFSSERRLYNNRPPIPSERRFMAYPGPKLSKSEMQIRSFNAPQMQGFQQANHHFASNQNSMKNISNSKQLSKYQGQYGMSGNQIEEDFELDHEHQDKELNKAEFEL